MRALAFEPTPLTPARRLNRLVPTAEVTVKISGLELAADLRDLSNFGFAIVASRPFWQGMTHQFTFASASGLEVTLVAKAVHCHSLILNDEKTFVTGWEFMPGSSELTERAIGRLLNAAAPRLSIVNNP